MSKQMQHAEDKQEPRNLQRTRRPADELASVGAGGTGLAHLQQQIGNRAVGRLLAQRSVPVVQRDPPTQAEIETSQARAGVHPDFPQIFWDLQIAAVEHRNLSYEDWRRITSDPDHAQRAFGRAMRMAWARVRNEFLIYLVGRVATAVLSAAITILPALQSIMDEARWRDDIDFRVNEIYLWLLKQLALSMASALRGYRVTGWDSGVQSVFQMLVEQTLNYAAWWDSYEARQLRVRQLEARPAGIYSD